MGLASVLVSLPVFIFLLDNTAAAWVLLLFPYGLCSQIQAVRVCHFHCQFLQKKGNSEVRCRRLHGLGAMQPCV